MVRSIGRMKRALTAGLLTAAGALLPLSVLAAESLSDAERAALELELEEARAELDAAAERLGALHGRLYAMETLGDHGRKPMLGVLVGERGPSGGLLLSGVTPGGGASAAGLTAGDEIVSVNGVDLTGGESAMARLKEAMAGVEPGDAVSVGYQRDGSHLLASVTTQAKGGYIMAMAGAPGWEVDVEMIQDLAAGATEHLATVDISGEWVGSLESLENLESLEALQTLAPEVHRAIRIAGPGGGLRLESISGDLAGYFGVESGVLVMNVPPVPDGAEAPLKAGDVLLAVNGEPIVHPGDGFRTLFGPRDGTDEEAEALSVELMRHGTREVVRLKPDQLGPAAVGLHGPGPKGFGVRVIAPPPP